MAFGTQATAMKTFSFQVSPCLKTTAMAVSIRTVSPMKRMRIPQPTDSGFSIMIWTSTPAPTRPNRRGSRNVHNLQNVLKMGFCKKKRSTSSTPAPTRPNRRGSRNVHNLQNVLKMGFCKKKRSTSSTPAPTRPNRRGSRNVHNLQNVLKMGFCKKERSTSSTPAPTRPNRRGSRNVHNLQNVLKMGFCKKRDEHHQHQRQLGRTGEAPETSITYKTS